MVHISSITACLVKRKTEKMLPYEASDKPRWPNHRSLLYFRIYLPTHKYIISIDNFLPDSEHYFNVHERPETTFHAKCNFIVFNFPPTFYVPMPVGNSPIMSNRHRSGHLFMSCLTTPQTTLRILSENSYVIKFGTFSVMYLNRHHT